VEDAIRRFLSWLEVTRGSAGNTLLAYRADLKQFQQVLSGLDGNSNDANLVSSQQVAGFVDWLSHQGYRPATISRKMAAVRSFLTYLHKEEGMAEAQLLTELRPGPAPRRRPRVLDSREVGELLAMPGKHDSPRALRDAAILSILYATGLRAADLVALTVDDVDLAQARVARPAPENGKIPLGLSADPVRRYLTHGRPHLARSSDEGALFLNQRGRRLSRQGLWLVVKRWARACGLGADVSPHTLRHTLAHHLLSEGKTRREVQMRLGLSSPNAIRVQRDRKGAGP
jgi:integrase/recombinase XerD